MSRLVYFSSVSGNTARFVEKLGQDADRIPLLPSEPFLHADGPYVLVLPTYGGGNGHGAVPKQVIKFLNDEHNLRSRGRRDRTEVPRARALQIRTLRDP
jgi:protein involved in ribonucleotide reduction